MTFSVEECVHPVIFKQNLFSGTITL